MLPTADCFKTIALDLQRDGYALVTDFIDAGLARALAAECRSEDAAARLGAAAIGQGRDQQYQATIRGDRTLWFDPLALSAAQAVFWHQLDRLRLALNQRLLLGMDHADTHYALYPPGSRYRRHLDRFRHNNERVLSLVCYLNPAWQISDGGALRLYLEPDGSDREGRETSLDITPQAGTLIVFLSASFEHEVMPATRTRLSIAAWFSQREAGTAPQQTSQELPR